MCTKTQKTENKNEEIGLDSIGDGLDQILAETTNKPTQGAGTGIASKFEVDQVIKDMITKKKLSMDQKTYNRVYASVCHMVQQGATSPKYADSRMVTDYGIDLKVLELRNACKTAGITVRKLARGIRDDVIKVAMKHGIEGNLSKNYKLENPNFDPQDLIWVSDFQTFSENPAMPENVRQWLLENYRSRFKPYSKSSQKGNFDSQIE